MDYKEFSSKLKTKYPQYNDMDDEDLAKKMIAKYPQYNDVTFEQPTVLGSEALAKGIENVKNAKGTFRTVWEGLKIPEQMAEEGLTKATEVLTPSREDIESGNVGVGGMMARTAGETLSEVAPSFISPESLATSGALKGVQVAKPVIGAIGKTIGRGAEGISGLTYKTPNVLAEAFNKPSLILAKGKQVAKPLYETAKAEIPEGMNLFKGMYKPEQIVDKANEVLAMGGKLEPAEALMARKAIDSLMNSGRYVKDELRAMRNAFDSMAKLSPEIAQADKLVSKGIKGEALRTFMPLNKTGTPSKFQIGAGAGGALAAMASGNPMVALALLGMSPAVQGATAAGLGLGAKAISPLIENPQIGLLAKPAIQSFKERFLKKRKDRGIK